MISLEQVHILQKKVESAVEKISQLQAENDALRTQCSELSNALSEKTEQLLQFERVQAAVESGIMRTLESLNAIDDYRGNASSSPEPHQDNEAAAQTPASQENVAAQNGASVEQAGGEQQPVEKAEAPSQENPQTVAPQSAEQPAASTSEAQPQQQGGQFDIF